MDSVVAPARSAALAAVFKPVHPPTTFEETVERLGTAIRLGLLAPGSRLPPERALAEELRISRSTLRQALVTLVQSGHLVALRGRSGGTFVADSPPLSEAGAGLLESEARGVLDYRVAIETGSTVLAAERATTEDLARLEALTDRMAGAVGFEDYRRADVRFHIGLAEAARSPRGLDGIEQGTDPGPELIGNAYAEAEAEPFPSTLREAVDRWESSEFAKRTFGEAVWAHYLNYGRTEQRLFDEVVTDYERRRTFERG